MEAPAPALKVRPFATAASAAAPRRIVRAPIWMWAASADGAIPPPIPEAYEAVADAPAPFRLGSALQDPYADYSGADADADHNFSWNEFTKGDGEKAKLLETAANMAALKRAMARMKAAARATAKAAAEAAARAAAAEAEPRSHSV